MEEIGAESEGGDEGESHSNNRLRRRTTKVARTRDESDDESRGSEDEDEEEWEHLQKSVPKQKNKLDLASDESHPVHAPFFPEVCSVAVSLVHVSTSCVVLQEKQEGWWLYMAEKRSRTMVTMPQRVTTLKDECSVRLSSTATPDGSLVSLSLCCRWTSTLLLQSVRVCSTMLCTSPRTPTWISPSRRTSG